ncbi:hypothetical protein [Sphingomonas immobilis]|uniref:Uncharacterized protein n=1 Tax=Sphingomonas immobilis TaxID=3063997 RepID=A0ABT9A095_9SPHN|nr:hypothetical protein [Sphingomonas sp. CA1-15]MDO7843256.1 hypothetical protein [Sphingomonas sp. CA1-15]
MSAIAALMIAAAPAVATATFHPVEGVTYIADTVVTRIDDGVTRRFHTARHIVFRRDGDGYLVEAVLQKADQQAPGAGQAFTKGNDALTGRTVRYRVDASGAVTAIEDIDTLIELIAEQIEKSAPDPARGAMFARPLRTAGPEQRRAMLASFIAPLIGAADAHRAEGRRPVTLPPQPPMPVGSGLPGEEVVTRDRAGILSIETRASGPITGPADIPGGSTATGSITLTLLRRIDPATGLLVESRSETTTVTAGPGAARTGKSETLITFRPAVSR